MGTSFLRASLIMTVLAALTSASHKGPDAPAAQSLHTGFTCVNGRLAKSGVRLTPPQERAVRLLLGEPMRPLDEALFAQDSSQELRASHRSATPDSGALLKEAAALEKEADKLRWGARRWVQEESQYAGLSHTPPSALIATFPAEMMALEKEQEAADLRRQSRGDDEGELGRGAFVDLNTLACVRASVPLAPRRSLSRAARASPPVGGAAGQRGVAGGRNAGDEEVGEAGREERERRRLFLAAPVGDSGFSADRVPLRTPGSSPHP
ncbi:hypothetical protein T484DRAFT_1810410 [Baffinella frigidus]|nr:hypothetical protein T484DRAFT_1810410 [Cryptophyta sp. CCMP2293]